MDLIPVTVDLISRDGGLLPPCIWTCNSEIYMHIYILPQCSTTAARVLNSTGMDVQSHRSRCAISRGILIRLLPAKTLAPQLEYRSFIKDAIQCTQKCRALIKGLAPESRILP